MNRCTLTPCVVLWTALVLAPSAAWGADRKPEAAPRNILLLGGCGGVYFLAEPGELTVDLAKRDRNTRDRHTELRAILAGPDRRVVDEATIPDDGRPRGSGLGPVQRVRLSTRVESRGVYALNITVSQDRYGENIVWGFRTNCSKYLIETSRGHRDARHQEPIVLESPERPADVCFLPRSGTLTIEVSGLAPGGGAPELFDSDGKKLASIETASGGRARCAIAADVPRNATPWRLHLPSARATIHIDGVTRWDRGDAYRDLCYWTPEATSWFPFLEHRWILTPYSRTAYGKPGEPRTVPFQIHAGPTGPQEVRLALEFPRGQWPVRLSSDRVSLDANETATVALTGEIPAAGATRTCRLRATAMDAPEFSTYSTLRLTAGEPPCARPLATPLMLEPYRHENEQLGYLPAYPLDNQVYFDLSNRPFVSTPRGISAARDGKWVTRNLGDSMGGSCRAATTKLAFDGNNNLYVIAGCGGKAALLRSSDGGETFSAHAIPGKPGTFDIEQFSGHNVPDGPPPFVRFTRTASDPHLIWRRLHDLELFVPRKAGDSIEIGKPILLSSKCIGLSAHSGIPSTVVSGEGKVHVAWGEATDPKKRVPGVPTYVATYDTKTRKLGRPALIGYGPPANDVHNSPSITMDSRGYLHVLIGTHGRPFQYVRSLQPHGAGGRWTKPVTAGKSLNQTYVGLVCGRDDTLHVVFRLWRSGPPFPHSIHATLAYQRKRPGRPWEPPRILVVAPFSEYSIFYHRLTIDRKGRLFLSYDYWSTYWFYRLDHFGSRRALMMSPDAGTTWLLANGVAS